jgi:REP element-mobilizing transposase RayT
MSYNPQIHHRHSIRLKGYDYSKAGLYFITLCVQDRAHLFGEIQNGKLICSDAGKMVETELLALPKRFTNSELHEFIIMPNHLHLILQIVETVGATLVVAQNNDVAGTPKGRPQGHAPTIGDIMDVFKSVSTVKYIHGVEQYEWERFNGKLWQRNYFEHIIRHEQSYQIISEYIINNPAKWGEDKFYN